MNSSSSPGTAGKSPAFQPALACSMRSLRLDTKFHSMKRGVIFSPPIMAMRDSLAASSTTPGSEENTAIACSGMTVSRALRLPLAT